MTASGATILIVDDEIHNRKLLEVLLQHEGYRTVSVEDGEQALASIAQNAPDLILLDVMMPVVDGYQVARILKANPVSLNIPIIMVSAQGDRTARLAGLNAGAEEFLTKPIDRNELWLRVRNLLRLKSDSDLTRDNNLVLEQKVRTRTIDLQVFRTAMDATADVVTLVDRRSMKYVEVNAAASVLFGYTRDELLSMGPLELIDKAESEDLVRTYDRIIAGGRPIQPLESKFRRRDGTEVWLEVNRQALRTDEGWTLVSVSRDITERKEVEARIQRLAHYDPLTGLPNRRLFQESLEKAMEQGDTLDRQVVLLYLDLDHFKDINDSLGHACGDVLLIEVGKRLLASLYVRDSVGRLGGDEFGIILLTPRDPDLAMIVAGKLHGAFRAPFQLGSHRVTVSASIGISIYPSDTEDADALARYADMAMYEAKRSGRHTTRFYTEVMNQRATEKLELAEALSEAFTGEQFVLHYQPKVSLRTGRWTGVEALLRWQRPGHGLVPPNSFIPALEESGLIVAVGAWVIATACRQLADWKLRGMDSLSIAVNVSALQLGTMEGPPATTSGQAPVEETASVELLSAVAACISAYEFSPGLLELEITESAVMADADRSIDILKALRAMGVALSVDDFGTGYSSLAYLQRFPLEAVKIDGSFVRDVITSDEDASIAVAIIGMAHRLNLKAIAECVETEEQMKFLQAHQCDQAQGYYFSKPLPVLELEALWNRTNGMFPQVASNFIGGREAHLLASAWPECDAFEAALLAGSRETSTAIVRGKLVDGHRLVDVYGCLIQPVLYDIGEKWRTRHASVAQEHMATALVLSIMAQEVSRTPTPASNGRKVLLACVEGNHHALGLQMVADAFMLDGWDVNFLGADVPADALIDHVQRWSPDLVGLSASMPQHLFGVNRVIEQLGRAFGPQCPHLLVGGLVVDATEYARSNLGKAAWAADPDGALSAGRRLCQQFGTQSARAQARPAG